MPMQVRLWLSACLYRVNTKNLFKIPLKGRIAALELPKKYSRTDVYAAFCWAIPPGATSLDRNFEQVLRRGQVLSLG